MIEKSHDIQSFVRTALMTNVERLDKYICNNSIVGLRIDSASWVSGDDDVKLIHWAALVVVLLLAELWVDRGDGQSRLVDFAAACSALSDKRPFERTALAQVFGEAHCAPSLIASLSTGRVVLWSPVDEDALSTKRFEANR